MDLQVILHAFDIFDLGKVDLKKFAVGPDENMIPGPAVLLFPGLREEPAFLDLSIALETVRMRWVSGGSRSR